jgi:hypothetical protein
MEGLLAILGPHQHKCSGATDRLHCRRSQRSVAVVCWHLLWLVRYYTRTRSLRPHGPVKDFTAG